MRAKGIVLEQALLQGIHYDIPLCIEIPRLYLWNSMSLGKNNTAIFYIHLDQC